MITMQWRYGTASATRCAAAASCNEKGVRLAQLQLAHALLLCANVARPAAIGPTSGPIRCLSYLRGIEAVLARDADLPAARAWPGCSGGRDQRWQQQRTALLHQWPSYTRHGGMPVYP